MKKRFLVTGFLLICLLLPMITTSCASEVRFNAKLGEQFTLPIGQTVNIVGQDLSIKFDAVTSDSRCPSGAECVWAGEAKCRMIIKYQETETEVIFTQTGSSISQAKFQHYIINFQLNPYPQVGQDIGDSDYSLEMLIGG
jgi:hypothetical protein